MSARTSWCARPAIAAIAPGLQLELTEGLGSEDSLGLPLPPSQLRTEQRLNADGSIRLRYAPLGCGPRSLSIKLQSADVVGSPLRLEVAAGAMQLRACELVGKGRSFCNQHENANFRVLAKDGYGNQLTRGGEKFVVLIRREGNEGPADDCDGSYAVEYTCETIGRHYKCACIMAPPTVTSCPARPSCFAACLAPRTWPRAGLWPRRLP